MELVRHEETSGSVKAQVEYTSAEISRLKRTSVLAMAFRIWSVREGRSVVARRRTGVGTPDRLVASMDSAWAGFMTIKYRGPRSTWGGGKWPSYSTL